MSSKTEKDSYTDKAEFGTICHLSRMSVEPGSLNLGTVWNRISARKLGKLAQLEKNNFT